MMYKNRLKNILPAFILTLFLNPLDARAQQSYPGDSFETRLVLGSHAIGGQGGALQDKLYGIDVSYQKSIRHITDNWAKRANAQSAGIGFVFRDLQYLKGHADTSAKSFGQAYGVVGQADFQLLKSGGTSVNFRPAIGFAYLSKTFFTDKRNRFIGSHLNEILKADLSVQMPLSAKVDLVAGAGYLHYSNGGFSIPNSGINMLSLSTGLRFKNADLQKKEYKTNFSQLAKNTFEINLGIGRRGVYESREGLLKSGLYAGYNFFINDILTLKSGFDAVYYYKVFDGTIQTFQHYGTSNDKWRTGLSIGAETTLWRLALNAQVGKYLHYNSYSEYEDINWFWTTGLVYYVSPHVGLQAKTYLHGSQADFINYGLVFKM